MTHLATGTSSPETVLSLALGGIGARTRIELTGPQAGPVHDRLLEAWSRCLDPADGPVGETVRVETGTDTPPEHQLAPITQLVTRALIGAQAGRLLMLHAGAVCHPVTGSSLVVVAEGGVGKTTLTRVLARHYGYLTDETVAIDADHRVLPYPKPLSVRPDPPAQPKQEHSPDDLHLALPPAEATVARLVLLDRDDDHADGPEAAELDLLDAITAIAPQSSALYALPTGLRRLAVLIESIGPVLRVRYTEAESLLDLAAELIGSPR